MRNFFYEKLYIADAHADTATTAAGCFRKNPAVHLDFVRAERVLNLQVFAFWERPGGKPWLEWQRFCRQQAVFTEALLEEKRVKLLRRREQLADTARTWAVLALEGADGLAWLPEKEYFLRELARMHVHILGLFWNNDNWLGCGADRNDDSGQDLGLTKAGREFLALAANFPVVLDLAHSSRRSFWDVCREYPRPFLVSHSCCAGLYPHRRNLDDAQLRYLGEHGGYVGIALYPYFLNGRQRATFEDVAAQIRYACNLAGTEAVGLGTDFDGIEVLPEGIAGCQDLPRLADFLHRRKMPYSVLEKVMGGNLRRFLWENIPSDKEENERKSPIKKIGTEKLL